MKQTRFAALLILPLAVVFLSGCPWSPPKSTHKGEQSNYRPQSSPAYCLMNLVQAYKAREITEYLKLFADDFTFAFSPADIRNPNNPTPVQWGMADERDATERMFTSETVERIDLTMVQDPATNSENEWTGTWKVMATNVRLQVDTRKEDGSQYTYLVDNGNETYYFKEYPGEKATDGGNLWRIWRWEDQPMGTALLASRLARSVR
jgi:hypothetical protein